MNLVATFPKDRSKLGTLEVFHNGTLLAAYPALGKADNQRAAAASNPSRDPLRQFGDTPTGFWTVNVGIIRKETHTYGPNPVLMLWPTSGQAVKAYASPGRRSGIWIHGGALNANDQLRPTYGCIRVHDETMARLHGFIKQYGRIETLETKEI